MTALRDFYPAPDSLIPPSIAGRDSAILLLAIILAIIFNPKNNALSLVWMIYLSILASEFRFILTIMLEASTFERMKKNCQNIQVHFVISQYCSQSSQGINDHLPEIREGKVISF